MALDTPGVNRYKDRIRFLVFLTSLQTDIFKDCGSSEIRFSEISVFVCVCEKFSKKTSLVQLQINADFSKFSKYIGFIYV